MWIKMFGMFSQFFSALTTLASAADHSAKALEQLAIAGEEAAAGFTDSQRHNRAIALEENRRALTALKAVKA